MSVHLYVKLVLADNSPFFCENGLVSGLHGVVVQDGSIAPRLGFFFLNWCHLEKPAGRYLEILFVDCILKILLLIDFKLTEPSIILIYPKPVSQLSCFIHLAYIHPLDMTSSSMCNYL